jgi:uncharacterized repeat protein (TIGR02543 family)
MKREIIIFILISMLSAAGCSNTFFDALDDFAEYSVTYKGNGSETGKVPDSAGYERGMLIAIPGNAGKLEKSDFTFTGWNTLVDGKGTNYTQYETLVMQPSDITLYARWSADIAIVSMAADDTPGNSYSYNSSVSSDGRYVAFYSYATNLVAGDTNVYNDIFIYDRDADGNGIFETGAGKRAITIVTIDSDGHSAAPSISSNGRYITFASVAENLVPGDTNNFDDIFFHDRDADGNDIFDETGAGKTATTLISMAPDGVTGGNSYSVKPRISGDGRYIAFGSDATNLVSGDNNGSTDVFVYDRKTAHTERVSVATDGTEPDATSNSPSISSDGRYITFFSWATNLVADDSNSSVDIFLRDRVAGTTTLISVASDGTQGNSGSTGPSISNDGIYIAFSSSASNLVAGDTNSSIDIFLHNRQTGNTTRVSVASDGTQGNNHSTNPSISGDGRYIAFESDASNLVAGDTNGVSDVFVYDRRTAVTKRVSVAAEGTESDDASNKPSISSDGSYVVFSSDGTTLVTGDTNSMADIFAAPVR